MQIARLGIVVVLIGTSSAEAQTALSTLEAHRKEATALFAGRLQILSQTKQEIARDQGRYRAGCLDRVTKGRVATEGEIPFHGVISSSLAISNETTSVCRILANDIRVNSALLRKELGGVEEDARRRGIYPGIIRELRAQFGLREDVAG